jgi:Type II secretion system (T2SS), protein G
MSRRFLAFAALITPVLLSMGAGQPPTPPAPAAEGDSHSPYQRAVESADGQTLSLEMAVREFDPPDPSKPKVYLAAAVHIGEKSFYEDLQKFLDGQDVVLFEGVKPPGAGSAENDQGTQTDADKAESTKRRVRFLAMAIERYRKKNGTVPDTLDELATKSEGRIASLLKGSLNDAWGHPLRYQVGPSTPAPSSDPATAKKDTPAEQVIRYDITSLGADGKEGGEGPAADIHFSDQKPLSKPETGDRSGGIQKKLADALGMVFQLDAMDNNKPNWRNTDLSLDQIQARLDAAGAGADGEMLFSVLDGSSMMGKLASLALSMMGSTAESRAMLRILLIETLEHADAALSMKMPGNMSSLMGVILEERNKVLFAELKKVIETEPKVHSIAVIYGAGHLPGVQKLLVSDLGYHVGGDTWRVAMQVSAKDAGMSAESLKQMRTMIDQSFEAQLNTGKQKKAKTQSN